MNIILTRDNLNIFKTETKLLNFLSAFFTRAYFKATSEFFRLMLRGQYGVFQTTIPAVTTTLDKPIYFSVDFNKWQIALQKFEGSSSIVLEFTPNLLKITSPDSSDVINLGVLYFKEDSPEAIVLDNFLTSKREEIFNQHRLTFTPEVVDALNFADSLFTSSTSQANSVGLGQQDVIYSDRSAVLKISLKDSLPSELFTDSDYIYIHSTTIKLLNYLTPTSNEFLFNSDFGTFYWEDFNSAIYMVSSDRKIALPSDEEFQAILPQGNGYFSTKLASLKQGLDFFTGFYEGSMWKPITFKAEKGKEVLLHYHHPTAEITKELDGVEGTEDGIFTVDSETLRKIITKLLLNDPEATLKVSYDEDGPGVLLEAPSCLALVSKLED